MIKRRVGITRENLLNIGYPVIFGIKSWRLRPKKKDLKKILLIL